MSGMTFPQFGVIDGPQFDYVKPCDPTGDVNPRKPWASWLNSISGELFICINWARNVNIWIGQRGSIGHELVSTENLLFSSGNFIDGTIKDLSPEGNDISSTGYVSKASNTQRIPGYTSENDSLVYADFGMRLFPADPEAVSICAWVNIPTIVDLGHSRTIFSEYSTSSLRRLMLYVNDNDEGFAFVVQSSPTSYNASYSAVSSRAIATQGWVHIAGTWSKGEVATLYYNGVAEEVSSGACPYLSPVSVNSRLLNTFSDSGTRDGFYGSVAGVKLFSRRLSPEEIAYIYQGEALNA